MSHLGPSLPLHAWRVLHSGLVDEVMRSEPDVCLAVTDKLGGITWEDFRRSFAEGTLRARTVGLTVDDVWIVVDFAFEPGQYRPAYSMRDRALGVDGEALIRSQDGDDGMTLDEMLGGDQ